MMRTLELLTNSSTEQSPFATNFCRKTGISGCARISGMGKICMLNSAKSALCIVVPTKQTAGGHYMVNTAPNEHSYHNRPALMAVFHMQFKVRRSIHSGRGCAKHCTSTHTSLKWLKTLQHYPVRLEYSGINALAYQATGIFK